MSQGLLLDVDPTARHEDDFYPTPAWQTRALLRRLPIDFFSRHRFLEPCVGDGAIVRELPATGDVVTNDIVARPPMVPDFLLDARRRESWEAFAAVRPLAIVGTNPTFEYAFDIAQHGYEFATIALFLLLRLSWLEPTDERGPWLKAHPPTRVIVMPRYDYRGNRKTDSVTSAWMVWAKTDWFCSPGVDIVTKDERDELIAQGARR